MKILIMVTMVFLVGCEAPKISEAEVNAISQSCIALGKVTNVIHNGRSYSISCVNP